MRLRWLLLVQKLLLDVMQHQVQLNVSHLSYLCYHSCTNSSYRKVIHKTVQQPKNIPYRMERQSNDELIRVQKEYESDVNRVQMQSLGFNCKLIHHHFYERVCSHQEYYLRERNAFEFRIITHNKGENRIINERKGNPWEIWTCCNQKAVTEK